VVALLLGLFATALAQSPAPSPEVAPPVTAEAPASDDEGDDVDEAPEEEAQAEEEPEETDEAEEEDDEEEDSDDRDFEVVGEEITVYAEERVRRARADVEEQLAHMGYDEEVEKVGDRTVFRHEAPWKGEVVLHDDGWTVVRRQPLRVEGRKMPWTKANTGIAWAGCFLYPWYCVRTGGVLVGRNKWRAVEDRTVTGVQPQVRRWGDRIADLATARKVGNLPDRLYALWEDGVPLDGSSAVVSSHQERRQALLAFWGSRTDTVWGEQVRRAVASFCRAVVQDSDHPFTDEEVSTFNASRPGEAPFDLRRRGI